MRPEAMTPPVSSNRIGALLAAFRNCAMNSGSHARLDLPGSRSAPAYGLTASSDSRDCAGLADGDSPGVPLLSPLTAAVAAAAATMGCAAVGREAAGE